MQSKDATPADKQLHLIADNYATHKHPKVQRWLARHRRFHIHFTPTSASWLNMVERFFRDLTENRIRRGVFRDVEELINAIDATVTSGDGADDSRLARRVLKLRALPSVALRIAGLQHDDPPDER